MAVALAGFLRIGGRVATGREWLDRAVAAAPPEDPLRPFGLYEQGLLAFWQGADEEARSLLERSLALARRRVDATAVAVALCGLARLALRDGDLERARELMSRRVELARDAGNFATVGASPRT